MQKKKRNKKRSGSARLHKSFIGLYYTYKTEEPLNDQCSMTDVDINHKSPVQRLNLSFFRENFLVATDEMKFKWRIEHHLHYGSDDRNLTVKPYSLVFVGKLDDHCDRVKEQLANIMNNKENPNVFRYATVRAEIIGLNSNQTIMEEDF